MRWLLLFALISPCIFANDSDPLDTESQAQYSGPRIGGLSRARSVESTLKNEAQLAARTDEAIANIISTATRVMERKGFASEAAEIRMQFGEQYQGFLVRMVSNPSRGIGDHKPLVQWLDTVYKKIEGALGLTVCKMLHISDIYSLNHTIPIVFHACTFPMDAVTIPRRDEYRNHFSGDGTYDGLVPVLTYWCVWGGCEAATWGAGWFFICSPLGSAAEYAMEKWVAPKLSDRIYDGACQ